ncbi:cilia- and flagella-associated protein 184 [Macrotis lagotis]|uniref:cilia- and flagella-associated protein 184 n=1 Tax=Macrotis lagotis TaxID=92651 RepID=UPI003D697DB1
MEVVEEAPEGARTPSEAPDQAAEEAPGVSEGGGPEEATEETPAEDADTESDSAESEEAEEAEEAEQPEEEEGEAQEEEAQEEQAQEEEAQEEEAQEEAGEAEEGMGEAEEEPEEKAEEEPEEKAEEEEEEEEEESGGDWASAEERESDEEEEEEEEAGEEQAAGGPEEEEAREKAPDEEELRLQEQQLRSELVEQYRGLMSERNRLHQYNLHLQHKISHALRKKKSNEASVEASKTSVEDTPEKEQTYQRYLASLEELKKQHGEDVEWYQRELEQLRKHCQEKLDRAEAEWRALQALKRQVMLQAMGSCLAGGKPAALRQVEHLQGVEDRKEREMSAVRLENVQLKQCLALLEERMRAQEELTEGLHLIDFEQLKIENQTFNEKVEERNEELLKLHHKVTSHVQIISHVKEKLQFVELENLGLRARLLDLDAQVAQRRDALTKTKMARDSLRADNVRLHQKCGLLGKEVLLRDLEQKVDQMELLSRRLEALKHRHAGLTLACTGLQRKIKESRAFLPA